MNEENQKLVLGFISGGLAAALFVFVLSYTPTKPLAKSSHILQPNPYLNIILKAKAAYVYKPQTGEVLYSKNSEAQLPLASITKVMSAIITKENLTPDTQITFKENKWRLTDLLNYTLMVSSNEAIQALAAAAATSVELKDPEKQNGNDLNTATYDTGVNNNVLDNPELNPFVEAMNEKARGLHLTQTYFLNEAGLDMSDTQSGAYGSARDVAHLFAYALKTIPESFEATTITDAWFSPEGDTKYPAINTNEAIGEIPGLIAGKTGYTDLAGGNLVVAFDAGMNDSTIAVVLGSTKEGRFTDIEQLVRATLQF